METILQNIDWMALFTAIWTIILVPIGKQIYEWLKSKRLDKYASILYEEVTKAVKSVYETTVKDIKGTSKWNEEKQQEVKELAKTKAVQALSNIVYKTLKETTADFDSYLDSLIGTVLYDIKHQIE